MKVKRLVVLGLLLVTLAGLAACGGNGGGSSGGGLLGQSDLMRALSYAPTSASTALFTDWTLIKQYKGAQKLTSQSDFNTRLQFMVSVDKDQAIAAGYDVDQFQNQATMWSWDTTDLQWEAEFDRSDSSGPPAYALKLRSDFDFSPVIAHFTGYGFSTSTYQGATIYSHPVDLTAPFFLDSFGIFNVAIVPSEKIMLLSQYSSVVHSMLDAHSSTNSSLAGDAGFHGIAAQMGAPASAIITQAAPVCSALGDSRYAEQVTQGKQAAGVSSLHAYTAMGMSYQQSAELIDLHYGSGQDAQSDLSGRKTLAANGDSLVNQQPYSQSLFTVTSASVSGSDLTLHVAPLNNRPQTLFDMFEQDDLLFAACS